MKSLLPAAFALALTIGIAYDSTSAATGRSIIPTTKTITAKSTLVQSPGNQFGRSEISGLPGAWLAFDVTRQGDSYEWHWQQSTDDNIAYYVPQYSTDGINFYDVGKISLFNEEHTYVFSKTLSISDAASIVGVGGNNLPDPVSAGTGTVATSGIGSVPGTGYASAVSPTTAISAASAGSAPTAASAAAQSAGPNSSILFRVKQVALDGTESFSPIRTTQSDLPVAVRSYPNPAVTGLNIDWPYADATNIGTYITNGFGKVILQQQHSYTSPVRVDLNGLPPGIYYLYCSDDKGHRSQTQAFSKLP